MIVTKKFSFDLDTRGISPLMYAVQGEVNTRKVEISLFSNGTAWEIPDGTVVAVAYRKPDGTNGLYDKLPSGESASAVSGNVVTVMLAPQVLTCAGKVMASIIFYSKDMVNALATFPFQIHVEKNPGAGEQISNNYYYLQNLDQVNAELQGLRVGHDGTTYANAGEAVRQQIGDIASAVFEDVEASPSANVFNPNTAEALTIGSTSGFVSEVIPCAVGDVIYGRFEKADGSLGALQQFGIYLIATNGTSVLTSANLYGKYTVPTHNSIPELLGVKFWVRESEVPYDSRSSVMVTVNIEPTEFEAWKEVTTTHINLVEKNRTELQAQIGDLQEQVENLQSKGTGNAVQYTVQNLTEDQKAQARANIGAAALPVVTDEDALKSSEGLTLSGNGLIPLGTWTTTSTDTPYMNVSGEKFCTKKIKTSVLPQIRGALAPWNYTFWKNGVNLGVQLTYTDAKAANFETDLVFDEVAVNYGYGYVDGISVTLFVPNTDAQPFNKVLVMGDSISTDYYGNYTKWVTVLMNEGFFPKDTTNDSIHATGFVAKYTADNPNADNDFLTRIEAVTNKDSYDLVVIFGGINDFIQAVPLGESGGDETVYFKPAVDYFFQYLVNNFTQARIVVLSPLRTYNPYPNQANVKQEEYAAYIREVAKSYCLPVLNLTEESGFCPFNETFKNMWTYTGYVGGDGTKGDGVHPSAEYEERFLAPMIRKFLSQFI